MLPRIRLAKLYSGDFRDRVRFIRWLKSHRQKRFFLDRLDRKPRVNARTPQKQKLFHAEIEACRNEIVLDFQIHEEKFDRKIVIGLNATDPSCCHDNGLGSISRKKLPNFLGIAQIQFIMSGCCLVGSSQPGLSAA
jgi:hypothetical protein